MTPAWKIDRFPRREVTEVWRTPLVSPAAGVQGAPINTRFPKQSYSIYFCTLLLAAAASMAGAEDTQYLWGLWHHPPTLAPFSAASPASPTVYTINQTVLDLPHKRVSHTRCEFNMSFPLTPDTIILSYANLSITLERSNLTLPLLEFVNWTRMECEGTARINSSDGLKSPKTCLTLNQA